MPPPEPLSPLDDAPTPGVSPFRSRDVVIYLFLPIVVFLAAGGCLFMLKRHVAQARALPFLALTLPFTGVASLAILSRLFSMKPGGLATIGLAVRPDRPEWRAALKTYLKFSPIILIVSLWTVWRVSPRSLAMVEYLSEWPQGERAAFLWDSFRAAIALVVAQTDTAMLAILAGGLLVMAAVGAVVQGPALSVFMDHRTRLNSIMWVSLIAGMLVPFAFLYQFVMSGVMCLIRLRSGSLYCSVLLTVASGALLAVPLLVWDAWTGLLQLAPAALR